MDTILEKQGRIQTTYAKLGKAKDPATSDMWSVGDVYDYISEMKFHLNEEIDELLLCLSNGDRSIHKPWSSKREGYRGKMFHATDETMGEAIDALCFMMNIMLVAGISSKNIEEQYLRVYDKIRARQDDSSY